MSVVCWDGKTMAADRQGVAGDSRYMASKLRLISGHLVGTSGGAGSGEMMFRWFAGGCKEEDFPVCQKDKDAWASLLVVTPQKKVLKYEMQPLPYEILNIPAAIGSGKDAAMGAMLAGADAVKAVEIASQVDIYCGMGVDAFKLEV